MHLVFLNGPATRVQASRHNVVVRTALILVNSPNFNIPRVQRGFYAVAINYASLSLVVRLRRALHVREASAYRDEL